ncbi:MAG: hypothetical protein BWX84_00297 [Verrucomicrobia bacterium ADurb.Bin118]|jgi:DNA-binding MarR family transcriptional regulator|nr:MAG: hypothetical protein BWX84_00297 [Verrucomicrobia bacterium ADurb.Bin118]
MDNEIIITIPVAIAGQPDLNLIEKAILAFIEARPACHNADLATLTGLSERGVESTLARLRDHGLIQVTGKGRARQLWLHVEHHSACGQDPHSQNY